MCIFGSKNSNPLNGSERVLAYLMDAQRSKAPLRVEDDQGREVPATLVAIAEESITLALQAPLAVNQGTGISLVLILGGLRFKSSVAVVLDIGPASVTLERPSAIILSERRKKARAYLNAREGATAIALAGLFNPLVAGSASAMEPFHALVDETGIRLVTAEGPRFDPIPVPMKGGDAPEARQPRTIKVEKPWSKTDVALDSIFWTSYVVDWLQTRHISRGGYTYVATPEQNYKTASGEYTVHANHYYVENHTEKNPVLGRHPNLRKVDAYFLLSGVTYAFMTRSLPVKWRRAYMLTSVAIEAHCVGNNIRLGIRLR